MAKGSIATAWIQVLPSLEGLQSALVKASKGAVLTPSVQPRMASGASRLFSSNGLGLSRLFSGSFNKGLSLQGGVRNALSGVSSVFGTGGRRSAAVFGNGFSTLNLDKYLNTAAAVAGVVSVGKAVKDVSSNIISMGNQWGQTTAMLKNAVGAGGDYAGSLDTSLKYANKVGVKVGDFVQSASRLRTLAPNIVTNYGDAAKFTKLFDMNMINTGASTEEASSAMRQITQALGKGIVNGDELNSILENSPLIAQMLAKHLNVSVGDLKELGKEGKISGQALYDAVLENADAIEKQFDDMPVTADRAWNSIKNTIHTKSSQASTALSANLGRALTAISDSGMTDTFGEMLAGFVPLSNAAATLASTFIGQLAPAVKRTFNAQQVEQFLSPLTNLISLSSQQTDLLSSFTSMLNTVGVVGSTAFGLLLATNDRFASRIPIVGNMLVGVKNGLISLGSRFTGAFGGMVAASSKAVDALAGVADGMSGMLSASMKARNALGRFNVAFEDLNSYSYGFGEKGAEGFGIVQQAAMNLRDGVGEAADNVRLLRDGLNVMGDDAGSLPETFLAAFETLTSAVDAASDRKLPSLVRAFKDVRAAVETIAVDSNAYRSLNVAGQDADVYRSKLVQVGLEMKQLTGFRFPDMFLPLVGGAMVAADGIRQTFGDLKTGLGNLAAVMVNPIVERFTAMAASVKTRMEVLRADIESGMLAMVEGVKASFGRLVAMTGIGTMVANVVATVGNGLATVRTKLATFGSAAVNLLTLPFQGIAARLSSAFNGVNPFAPLMSAAKSLRAGLSATVGGAISRLVGRFAPFTAAGRAAFAAIGMAASKVASGALKAFGVSLRGLGAAIGKVGGIASQLGVSGALFTGVTAGFQALFRLDPSQMTGKFDEWQHGLDDTLARMQNNLPAMAEAFAMALPKMAASIASALPGIMKAFESVGRTLAPTLMELLPQIAKTFSDIFGQLPSLISAYAPSLLSAVGSLFATLAGQIPTIMLALGQALAQGIKVAFDTLASNGEAVAGFIEGFGTSLGIGIQTLGASIAGMLPTLGQSLAAALPTLIPALLAAISDVVTSLAVALPGIAVAIVNQLPVIIGGLASGIVNGLPTLVGAFISVAGSLGSALPGVFMAVVGAVPGIIVSIARPFAGLGGRILGHIRDIPGQIKGLFAGAGSWLVASGAALLNGFKQGILGAIDSVKGAVKGALQKIRDFFPFSPAKVGPFSGSGYTSVSGEHLMRDFGKAIGAQGGFVQGQVDGVLGSLDFNQVDTSGLGMVTSPRFRDYTGMVGYDQPVGGVHIDNVVASPLSDVELVARRFGYALNNEMIGSVRP